MPMYYFHLKDDAHVLDVDGTEFATIDLARAHARTVARELMFKRETMLDRDWSEWTMSVRDGDNNELFSFAMCELQGKDT
jgi:Domain of unknown function (DUF6894)